MTKQNFINFLLFSLFIGQSPIFSEQNIGKCESQKKFEILPGRGWDNLMNRMMGQVSNYNYSKCRLSQDSKYVLPNDISLIGTRVSQIGLKFEMFDHYKHFTSGTSYTINLGFDMPHFGLGGSFSTEHQMVKEDQLATKCAFTRVSFRYSYAQTLLEPDAELNPVFRNRIMDIVTAISNSSQRLLKDYLADLVVRDYGTHVIQAIDAGAILTKIDFLKPQFIKKLEMNVFRLSVLAEASFEDFFKFHFGYEKRVSVKELEEYNISAVMTRTDAYGGRFVNLNRTLDDWINSIENNLTPVDIRGVPVYQVITKRALPELDDKMVYTINNLLKDAVNRYVTANIRPGCMDYHSKNFNPNANVEDGTCQTPEINFTVGGVFQTCDGPDYQCTSVRQINFLTGNYSCPSNFTSVLLFSGQNRCEKVCTFLIFGCRMECSNYSIYWCYPNQQGQNLNGFMFGGVLSPAMPQCPLDYESIKIGLSASICVTTTRDIENNIRFGGFYSCNMGNPLAQNSSSSPQESWPKHCSPDHLPHIINIESGCQLAYCSQTNNIFETHILPPRRPPFVQLSHKGDTTIALK